jgi:hypothetical protein
LQDQVASNRYVQGTGGSAVTGEVIVNEPSGSSTAGTSALPVVSDTSTEGTELQSDCHVRFSVCANDGFEVQALSDRNVPSSGNGGHRNDLAVLNGLYGHSGILNDITLPKFVDSSKQNPV